MKKVTQRNITPPAGVFPADSRQRVGDGMPHDMGGHEGAPAPQDRIADIHTRDNHVVEVVVGQRK